MGRTRFDFTGQVVVLTGAARGIGQGAAEAFAAAGARVYVVDVDDKAGEVATRAIREGGGQATFVAADATSAAQVTGAFDRIIREAGRPFRPRDMPSLVENHCHGECLGFPGRPEHRSAVVARDCRQRADLGRGHAGSR